MRNKIKYLVKSKLQFMRPFIRLILWISEWQNANFPPLRWLGLILSVPFYVILRDDYYKLMIFSKKLFQPSKARSASRFIPETFFIKAITGNNSVDEEMYEAFLKEVHFDAETQSEWARRFMEVGRLDLARVGYINLIKRADDRLPFDKQLQSFRNLGAVCFMLGKNNEANHYWQLAGKLRRAIYKPTTPKNYRILGSAWFVAIGHIAMLDYYIKFKKLHGDPDARIVAQWDDNSIPGQDLFNKFAELGIAIIRPGLLENDYNKWAATHSAPKWNQLTAAEKAVLIDDFWEYDFSDGEILGYAHAAARIQSEWKAANRQPLLSLTQPERLWIQDYLVNLGVPRNAWFVCLHVREPGFHKQWNTLYPSMRDADINDYTLAIQKVVDAGGWVLRMGDPSMKPLPPMRNVVDYAHSIFKTATADILLAAGCKFFLGTNSGYATISAIYNVPCLLTNWVPLGWPLWPHQDLMVPKLFRDKKSGQFLNLEEIFQRGLGFIQNWSDLPDDIELVANTPEELASVTTEMLLQCGVINEESFNIKKSSSVAVQNHYTKLALQYGAFTGSQFANTFIAQHPAVFSVPETNSIETNEGNQISWHAQSNNSMTATLS